MRALSCILLLATSPLATSLLAQAAEPILTRYDRHYDGVLGTSMDVSLYGAASTQVDAAMGAALAEIARLDAILSTWRDDSVLMTLNRARSGTDLPEELLEVLRLCETWRERSRSIFSCRLGQVIAKWDAAEQNQELPEVPQMLPVARTANQSQIVVDAANRAVTLGEAIDIEPSGLAKGYVIDRALAVLRAALPESPAIKVDIGGDAVYWGAPPTADGWEVQVADPAAVADNGGFISTVSLNGLAIATSGHDSRTRTIGNRVFSHILDTRRGWPVAEGSYAVAIAADAASADAIATALAAQQFELARAWAEGLDNVAVLLANEGNLWTSPGWQTLLGEELQRQTRASISMAMDYAIPRVNGSSYERPYVAVWVSDTRGTPLRNLLLLGGEQRWASTNSIWWRRTGRRGLLEVNSVTRPTRTPGEYQLVWDGKDDTGASVLEGEYLLNVEASREYGGHDLVSLPFTVSAGTQSFSHPGEGEVGPFSFSLEVQAAD